jgi:DNA-binding transcriptional regulator LsrR (DeoR family)
MDLVKVPKNASAGDKLKVKAIRAYLRTQLWKLIVAF